MARHNERVAAIVAPPARSVFNSPFVFRPFLMLIPGLTPGPALFKEHADVVWGIIASLYIGNVIEVTFFSSNPIEPE